MQKTDETVANLFTKGSHHRNVSVVFLAQNLFPKNKFARTMRLNAHYIVLFKNPERCESVCKFGASDVSKAMAVRSGSI